VEACVDDRGLRMPGEAGAPVRASVLAFWDNWGREFAPGCARADGRVEAGVVDRGDRHRHGQGHVDEAGKNGDARRQIHC